MSFQNKHRLLITNAVVAIVLVASTTPALLGASSSVALAADAGISTSLDSTAIFSTLKSEYPSQYQQFIKAGMTDADLQLFVGDLVVNLRQDSSVTAQNFDKKFISQSIGIFSLNMGYAAKIMSLLSVQDLQNIKNGIVPAVLQSVRDVIENAVLVSAQPVTNPAPAAPASGNSTAVSTSPAVGSADSSLVSLNPAGDQAGSPTGTVPASFDSQTVINAINQAKAGARQFWIDVKSQASAAGVTVPIGFDVLQAAQAKGGSDAALVVSSALGTYQLPLSLSVSNGSKISVTIAKTDAVATQIVNAAASQKGLRLVGTPVEFSVVVTDAAGSSQPVENFGNTYVARSIAVDQVDPAKTVAVLVSSDGKLLPVPTYYVQQPDGSYQAVINRTGNSTYALVTGAKTFADIQGYWAQADIEKMAAHLLVNGESETAFAPDDRITRAEFTSLLVRALGLSDRIGLNGFADVADNMWFAHDVKIATSIGLVKGDDGLFRPDQPIRREEMAVMLARAISFTGQSVDTAGNLNSFRDGNSADSWATSALAASVQAGILKGDEQNRIRPAENATRAEGTVMLERLMRYLKFMN